MGTIFVFSLRKGKTQRVARAITSWGGGMRGGFALVAVPAEYGNSGIMSFIVNQGGVVFEKDLGPDTAKVAAGISAFDPDPTWNQVQ